MGVIAGPVAQHLIRAKQIIQEHGWSVQLVSERFSDTGAPTAYTAGLTAAGLPELLIVGLPVDRAGSILDLAARRSLAEEPSHGATLTGVATVALRVRQVDNPPAAVANVLFTKERVRLLQLLWPDSAGAYPGDPDWSLGDIQDVKKY